MTGQLDAPLRLESFTVQGAPGEPDPRAAAVVRASDHGFLEPARDGELMISQLDRYRGDGTVLTAVYDDAPVPGTLGAGEPVSTFGDFVGSLCVAPGAVTPAQLITDVSVRTSHRRRGILRAMMTSALDRGRQQGLGLAALTASEGGIYGRFGFGVAAWGHPITVRVRSGLHLLPHVQQLVDASGIMVTQPDPDAFPGQYAEAFAAFQARTPGQIGSTEAYRRRVAGHANPWAEQGGQHSWRRLVALGADGTARGWAIAEAAWEAGKASLTVLELGAADAVTELALWQYLGATDLVEEITFSCGPADTVLTSALANPRDAQLGTRKDRLWLRLLDLDTAFSARGLASDGVLGLRVHDRLGHVDGEHTVVRESGSTRVEPGLPGTGTPGAAPVLETDAQTLASLFLGALPLRSLLDVGRARLEVGDAAAVQALLGSGGAPVPYNAYGF